MKSKFIAHIRFHIPFPFLTTKKFHLVNSLSPPTFFLIPRYCSSAALTGSDSLHNQIPKSEIELALAHWGCNEHEISKMFTRQPSLRNSDVKNIQSKLQILSDLGITPSTLVKIINCRPRFLTQKVNHCFDEIIPYLENFFGCKELLVKAIMHDPSLLTYDLNRKIKPAIAMFRNFGISPKDLVPMFIARPTLIPQGSLDDEKMVYILRTGVPKECKMYKYVVATFSVSRLETIQERVANLERFGFSEDEVLTFFGRSPYLLCLSVDKVQRNMIYILGTMKLPAEIVMNYPFLLFCNLDAVLKPRYVVAQKIDELGLEPHIKGPNLMKALRQTEERFKKVYITCHEKTVADELMDVYTNAKCTKRLAKSSKKSSQKRLLIT